MLKIPRYNIVASMHDSRRYMLAVINTFRSLNSHIYNLFRNPEDFIRDFQFRIANSAQIFIKQGFLWLTAFTHLIKSHLRQADIILPIFKLFPESKRIFHPLQSIFLLQIAYNRSVQIYLHFHYIPFPLDGT